jgi:hypothetical protein
VRGELERRLRENEGRRLWPDFRRSVAAAIGNDIADDRLPLAETAVLRDAFIARLRSGRDVSKLADTRTFSDLLAPLDLARRRVGARSVILLHRLDRSIGALRVPSAAILASPQRLLELLGGDLFVTTEGAEDGLALSIFTAHVSRTEDRNEYMLWLWGCFAES